MKNLFILLLLFFCDSSRAQYFYKDIVGTTETNATMQKLVAAKIRSVMLKSFDADGSLSEGFYVSQAVSLKPYTLKTITRSGTGDEISETSLTAYFNDNLQLEKTVDSSEGLVNISTYEYNGKGHLMKTLTETIDSTGKIISSEEHEWTYSEPGRIARVTRRKNKLPAGEIQFVYDNSGNLIEEQTIVKGKITESLYYYYNDDKQMTDIVRYNVKAKRLLPDYMFEYSEAGQVIQKITVPSNNTDYLIWRYQYDARGLKVKEACYNKYKDLLGKIEYTYSTAQ